MKIKFAVVAVIMLCSLAAFAQKSPDPTSQIPKGAKVFIAPMPNDFDTFLKTAIGKKKVPIEIVEDASIQIANLASGEVVFAYSGHQQSSTHGRQSAAESCAKHIKERVEP
jgi:hypothetical protein